VRKMIDFVRKGRVSRWTCESKDKKKESARHWPWIATPEHEVSQHPGS